MSQLFLDSGAFSIFWQKVLKKEGPDYSFYETDDFWAYVDKYASFVKQYCPKQVDYYANIDAIYNPELSWEMQKRLENKHGLNPVPVIHTGTDVKWVQHYLDEGYDLIGLGGMGQPNSTYGMRQDKYIKWADRCFSIICNNKDRMPMAKIHGFGITSQTLLFRYPWYSVDSTSWIKRAGFGKIFMPHYRGGQFIFNNVERNYDLFVSDDSPYKKHKGRHYENMPRREQRVVLRWLEEIDIPLGTRHEDGTIEIEGVSNHMYSRAAANLIYFRRLIDELPEWPWPLRNVLTRPQLF